MLRQHEDDESKIMSVIFMAGKYHQYPGNDSEVTRASLAKLHAEGTIRPIDNAPCHTVWIEVRDSIGHGRRVS